MQPNEKGKVKPRYRSKNQSRLLPVRNTLIDAGSQFYNTKKYDSAVDAWGMFVESADAPLFEGKVQKDSTFYLIARNISLAYIHLGKYIYHYYRR